jgi:drug/metabolite transporter (DMT)-like permease
MAFDEAAFARALQDQLSELQALSSSNMATLSSSSSLLQYQESISLLPSAPRKGILDLSPIGVEAEDATAPSTAAAKAVEDGLWQARLLLVGAAALYGTTFSLVKLLGDTMPVGISTTLRFGLAALVTMPWLVSNLHKKGAMHAAWLGFEVGMFNSIGYVTQAVGLGTTEASKSAFVCSLAVVVVPLLDFLTGKRLEARQWIGVLMAVVGVAFLELGGDAAVTGLSDGDLLSLVQPLVFGMGFWKMERAMHQHPEEASRITAGQLFAVFLASAAYGMYSIDFDIPSAMVTYPWQEWLSSPSLLFGLFWTGCITTALTIYMETVALKTLSAAETTLIFSTEPVWGTAFAAIVMGEQLGPEAGIGAFCILTACVYSNLGWKGIQQLLNGGKTSNELEKVGVQPQARTRC